MAAWEYFTNQKQWETYLKDLLKKSDAAVVQAIVCIYDNQTDEEKSRGESIEDNNIGFSKIDAYEMGSLAKKIKRGEPLTKGELAKSRNKMQKYWKQLMVISKRKAEARKMEEQRLLDEQAEQEAYELQLQKEAETEAFRHSLEILRLCVEEGKSCDYGICDECPNTIGYQMKLDI